jgi:hypothetical protein
MLHASSAFLARFTQAYETPLPSSLPPFVIRHSAFVILGEAERAAHRR